jgi:hypothetical protein
LVQLVVSSWTAMPKATAISEDRCRSQILF